MVNLNNKSKIIVFNIITSSQNKYLKRITKHIIVHFISVFRLDFVFWRRNIERSSNKNNKLNKKFIDFLNTFFNIYEYNFKTKTANLREI